MRQISAAPSYLDEKEFSPKAFIKFLNDNKGLVVISIIAVFVVYGIKLTNICYGIDTELHMNFSPYVDWPRLGRFGLIGLQKLWTNLVPGKELFNPYFAVFAACFFLFSGTLLWCYTIDFFSNGRINNIAYMPFAALFISHQVWVEQISFILQAAECLFIVFLSPFAVYFLFEAARKRSVKKALLGCSLTIFCASVYQASLVLVLCGIFATFFLFYESSNLESKAYSLICARLAFLFCAGVVACLGITSVVQAFLHIQKDNYFERLIAGGEFSFFDTIIKLVRYVYELVFAHSPLAGFVVAKTASSGWKAVDRLRESVYMANIIYAPVLIIYFFIILRNKRKFFLSVAAAICVPLSSLFLPALANGVAMMRTQYVLPFAIGFVFLYVVSFLSPRKSAIALVLFSLCGAKQCLVSGMLNYSDVIRYQSDVRLCGEIAVKIKETNATDDTPVFIYGVRHPPFLSNFIKGETCGQSPFEAADVMKSHATMRVVAFMRNQGYYFIPVGVNDEALIKKAFAAGKDMSDFPRPGSVKNLDDVVVVRLSELP